MVQPQRTGISPLQDLTTEQLVVVQLESIGQQLTGVASDVSELKRTNDLFRQNLLGDVEGETPHGRVPKIEAEVLDLRARVVILENAHIKYKAYGAVIGVLSGMASAVVTSVIVMLLQYALSGGRH